jgi:peptide/nickel transport system ATP-binding protein
VLLMEPLLEVRNLSVHFPTEDGVVRAVDDVSFTLGTGETLGVVGESGSGKSVSFLAVMGLVDRSRAQVKGEVIFKGQDLLTLPEEELRTIRGAKISMIFQDPMTSLHPYYRVGDQVGEVIRQHRGGSKKQARAQAAELLGLVGIPRPDERVKQYPHEFSGGMRQRAMIAMALALDPDLLIADEPTTALDVTVQAQILELVDRLKREFDASVVLITHDLGVVAEHCDTIQVMYGGRIAEVGTADDIYRHAHHPYTWGLLESIVRMDVVDDRLRPIRGAPPSLISLPPGCSFEPRCPHAFDRCRIERPDLIPANGHHASACFLTLEEKEQIFSEEVKPG